MKKYKCTVLSCFLILIISLGFMSGCHSTKTAQTFSSAPQGVLPSSLNSISKGATIKFSDDMPDSLVWVPKSLSSTLSKVTSWLEQAEPYNGEIPSSQLSSDAGFYVNIEPSAIFIYTTDKHRITIQPVWYLIMDQSGYKKGYLNDTLKLSYDEQYIYIQSAPLFSWLKDNEWQLESDEQ